MERHGRALQRGQLGLRAGLPPQPSRRPLLLPPRHTALVIVVGRRWRAVRRGVRCWLLVEQRGSQLLAVRRIAAAGQRCVGADRCGRRAGSYRCPIFRLPVPYSVSYLQFSELCGGQALWALLAR